jgi:2-oxoglutarate ferredoxin oxidoreductase subunit alpha
VLSEEELENMGRYGRYLDVDGDGIPYRTIPGTHPTKGGFTTRGTSRDEYAAYTEDNKAYQRNMERLLAKWETARAHVPAPELYQASSQHQFGILFYGTSTYSSEEARDILTDKGIGLDAIRIKAFPFNDTVKEFIASHQQVFVIEQNRDAQLRSLLMMDLSIAPGKLVPVLNFDGMPITADFIAKSISSHLFQEKHLQHDLYQTHI